MGEITWSIVKFLDDEDAVESVPTSWLLGSNKCYWPPFPKEKLVNCIRKQERPNTCWPLHNVMLFRNGTYDDYIVARNKARKAENNSDLNSDSDIKARKLKKKKIYLSSSDESEFSTNLPLPPKMPKTRPNTESNMDSSIGPLQELLFTQQAAPHTSNNKSIVDSDETLELLEDYLSEKKHFEAAVTEMSKIGGSSPYDFMKRCLNSMLTNSFASKYSWLGAKKKIIFGKLKVADLLREAAQVGEISNRKSSEEAIKSWLRRAKERHISATKKMVPPQQEETESILFLP